MTTLAFDIETVPDVSLGRRLYGLEGIPDEDVAKAMTFQQMQTAGTEFLPLYQHRSRGDFRRDAPPGRAEGLEPRHPGERRARPGEALFRRHRQVHA